MAKFCPNCGTNYDDNMMNCPNCGAPAPQMNNNQFNQQYNQQQYQQPMGNQQYNPQFQQQPMPGAKSKIAAGLLGIFLGGWGVHNFYLGNTSRGVIQIVVSLVTCGLGAWWGLIEGILILCGNINTDAQGRPLQ
jgi:TM2 domain-containing membrane protein YozV